MKKGSKPEFAEPSKGIKPKNLVDYFGCWIVDIREIF